MYYGFLSLLIAVSFVDIFFHRGLGVAPMALLFVVLKLQADRAADILIRRGLSKPVSNFAPKDDEPMESWMPPPEKDPFASAFKEAPRLEAPKPAKAEAKKEASKSAKTAEPKKRAPFRAPKFHGAPHEVLGLEDPDANTNMIKKAFRHWIKEFHPDHAKPGKETQRATERSRHLNQAKESLLDRRRQMRKAA
jgi:hypothetical protein